MASKGKDRRAGSNQGAQSAAQTVQPGLHARPRSGSADRVPRHSASAASAQQPRRGAAPAPTQPPQRHPRLRRVLIALLWLAALGVAALMALRYAPSAFTQGRKVPQLAAFVPWLTVPAVALLALAARLRRRALAVLCALLVAAQVVWHAGYFLPADLPEAATRQVVPQRASDDDTMRIMTLNCMNGEADAEDIVRAVRTERVELLALQEVSNGLLDRLNQAGIAELLPYRLTGRAGWRDNGGVNCLFSLAPLEDADTNVLSEDAGASATPAATVTLGSGVKVRFWSVHPSSPKTGQRGLWNTTLTSLGQSVGDDVQYVLLGDFNATWDHLRFRRLLGNAGLVDASQQAGAGFHMTYPSSPELSLRYAPVPVPFPLMEIDHILYPRDGEVVVGALKTLRIAGTDHMALLGTLAAR